MKIVASLLVGSKYVNLVLMHTFVDEEVKGTHASLGCFCNIDFAAAYMGKLAKSLAFYSPSSTYVDLVLIDKNVKEETTATVRWRVTSILQVMYKDACADRNPWQSL